MGGFQYEHLSCAHSLYSASMQIFNAMVKNSVKVSVVLFYFSFPHAFNCQRVYTLIQLVCGLG